MNLFKVQGVISGIVEGQRTKSGFVRADLTVSEESENRAGELETVSHTFPLFGRMAVEALDASANNKPVEINGNISYYTSPKGGRFTNLNVRSINELTNSGKVSKAKDALSISAS